MTSAKTAHFLLNGTGDDNVSSRLDPFGYDLRHSVDLSSERAFDIHGTAAPDLVIMYLCAKGRIGPSIGVTHCNVVEVGVEHDSRCVSAPTDEPDKITRFVDPNLVVTQLLHCVTNHFREWTLVSGKTFRPNQALYEIHTLIDIDHSSAPTSSISIVL
jgi:hypothetical protein